MFLNYCVKNNIIKTKLNKFIKKQREKMVFGFGGIFWG